MEEYTILVCDESNEGIFTAIYEAYERKLNHACTQIQIGEEENLKLFSRYIMIDTDIEKANKVVSTIKKKFGMEAATLIFEALATTDKTRGQAVYQTVVFGLLNAYRGNLMDCIYHDAIAKVVSLSTNTYYELHHFYGFLRFEELEGGIMFSRICPKNHLLPLMGSHFSNRFPNEDFVIYDKGRDLCLVHPGGKEWFIASGSMVRLHDLPGQSASEKNIQDLFTHFCHKIAIKERENKDLQRQMLPLRFREDMVEFN